MTVASSFFLQQKGKTAAELGSSQLAAKMKKVSERLSSHSLHLVVLPLFSQRLVLLHQWQQTIAPLGDQPVEEGKMAELPVDLRPSKPSAFQSEVCRESRLAD